jgi:phosphoribosylformylglycinamidine synthase
MASQRYAVHVMPKPGILDPQGKAVEHSLPHLQVAGVHGVRVGRRVELTVEAESEDEARAVVERLARELFANPLIETWALESLGAASTAVSSGGVGAPVERPASTAPADRP